MVMQPRSRRRVYRLMRSKAVLPKGLGWLSAAVIGAAGGVLLGNLAIGDDKVADSDYRSYALVTGNPDALGTASAPIEPCYDCGVSYGPAMRLASADDDRMDASFRELGAVEIDYSAAPTEDYDYGGRFDEPEAARRLPIVSPVPTVTDARAPAASTIETPIVTPVVAAPMGDSSVETAPSQ